MSSHASVCADQLTSPPQEKGTYKGVTKDLWSMVSASHCSHACHRETMRSWRLSALANLLSSFQ